MGAESVIESLSNKIEEGSRMCPAGTHQLDNANDGPRKSSRLAVAGRTRHERWRPCKRAHRSRVTAASDGGQSALRARSKKEHAPSRQERHSANVG
eukprot:4411627-Pyramimonas_sp.AAC.1